MRDASVEFEVTNQSVGPQKPSALTNAEITPDGGKLYAEGLRRGMQIVIRFTIGDGYRLISPARILNTAKRSVRFAFVNALPDEQELLEEWLRM